MTFPITFGGIEREYSERREASILLQSIPYDGTSTWGKGADKGFDAFLNATTNMELFDIETNSEVYKKGIHILPEIDGIDDPEMLYKRVLNETRTLLKEEKFLTFIGGEHSVCIGIIEAFIERYPELTVLQLDAHADLRPIYNGSQYNHACALHQASKTSNLIQVGIRSMDSSEMEHLNPFNCYFAEEIVDNDAWMDGALASMTDNVYITFDLDVLDPSIMPATGTPEPGGLGYYRVLRFLKKVFDSKNVVGFDIVELAPINGITAPEFLVAKLYYKMLSYKFSDGNG